MRYRIGNAQVLGIGRNIGTDFKLDNYAENLSEEQANFIKEICGDFLQQFASWYSEGMREEGYMADFGFEDNCFYIGWEPSYQYEPLNVICFDLENKDNSFRTYGTAFGVYGTKIASKVKHYNEYKYKNKYIKFIDTYYYKLVDLFKNNS